MDSIVIEQPTSGLSIEVQPSWATESVTVNSIATSISVEVNLAASGPKGDKGDKGDTGEAGAPGPNLIGGYAIELSTPANNDLLAFQSNKWVNRPQSNITDGGNF
jgi:hypothetical protein